MTARRFREYEPEPLTDLPLFSQGEAARDRIFDAFEEHKAEIVKALREEAHRLYGERRQPISANDIRHVLKRFPDADARILVSAFRGWRIAGETKANGPRNHARRIFTYTPR